MRGWWLMDPSPRCPPLEDIQLIAQRALTDQIDLRYRPLDRPTWGLWDNEDATMNWLDLPIVCPAVPGTMQKPEISTIMSEEDASGSRRCEQVQIVVSVKQAGLVGGQHVMLCPPQRLRQYRRNVLIQVEERH